MKTNIFYLILVLIILVSIGSSVRAQVTNPVPTGLTLVNGAVTALGVNVAAGATGTITTGAGITVNSGSIQVQTNQGYFFNGQGGLRTSSDGTFALANNAFTQLTTISAVAPTVTSGCGSTTTPTFGTGSTATSWSLTMGSTPGTSCVIALPTATNQWVCFADDISTIADTTTQATPLANNAATLKPLVSWAASDVLVGMCIAH
jgi:hypothetical protein